MTDGRGGINRRAKWARSYRLKQGNMKHGMDPERRWELESDRCGDYNSLDLKRT